MFEKLILNDFQSHKNTEIAFSPGVNTIIGTSDHGKSSIFRALNLICNNKPEGSHFVSHWLTDEKGKIKGNTKCTLYVDDNVVERIKGKTNEYKLNGESLKAFQRDVPEEISNVLNLDKANIQHQSDNFFLLNIPSTKVAEELNKIVNLEIIDQSVSNVNAKLREVKSEYKVQKELISNYENNLKKFKGLKSCEKEIKKILYLDQKIKHISNTISNLNILIDEITNLKQVISKYSQLSRLEEKMLSIVNKASEIKLIENKSFELNKIIKKTKETFRHLAKCRCLVKLDNNLEIIISMYSEIQKMNHIPALTSIVSETKSVKKNIAKYNSEIILLEKQYKNMMPDICPLCNRPINHEIHTNSRQSLSV